MHLGSRIVTFIIGIILGVALTVGCVFGGVFYISSLKVSAIEELLKKDFGLNDDVKNLTVTQYVNGLVNSITKLDKDGTIGDLEKALGADLVSSKLDEFLGIGMDVIKSSTLKSLPDALMNNLTVASISEKFGVTFPDLPVFKDEAFTNQPLKTAFASFDNFKLKDFVKIVTDEDVANDPTLVASNKILQKLANESIKNLSTNFDSILGDTPLGDIITPGDSHIWIYLSKTTINGIGADIDNMTVADVFEITSESSAVLKKLVIAPVGTPPEDLENYGTENVKISELSTKLDETTKSLKLKDIIKIDENSTAILQALQDTTVGGLSDGIDALTLSQAVKIIIDPNDPNYDPLLFALKDVSIKNFATEAKEAINGCSLDVIIKIDDTSPLILQALNGRPISEINEAVRELKFHEVIEVNENSPYLFKSLKNLNGGAGVLLTSLGSAINDMTLGEMVEIKDTDHVIMQKIKGFKLNELSSSMSTVINGLTLDELLGQRPATGILSLLTEEEYNTTTVTTLATTLSTKMTTTTIGELKAAGLINANIADDSPLLDMTLDQIIAELIRLQGLIPTPPVFP